MRTTLLLTALAGLLAPLARAASAAAAPSTSITLHIPPSQALPNPRTLPASTHATLTSLGTAASAYLTPANTFVFRNVSEGSYLVDVYSGSHAFAPLRVDVLPTAAAGGDETEGGGAAAALSVRAWETFRGNDWDNKGESMVKEGGRLEVRVLGQKAFFMERSSFNVLSILKSPMILLGIASMAIFIGMPYLVDNMDPEMRKEWEESQKSNPMNTIMGGGGSGASNFDMAAFMAGSTKDDGNNNGGSVSAAGIKKERGSRK